MAITVSNENAGRSQWLVLGLTVIALLLGLTLKSAAAGQTREVTSGGVTVGLPTKWVVETFGTGILETGTTDPTRVLASWDPLDPGTRYLVSLMPVDAESSLATAAWARNLQRAQALSSYRVLEQTPVTLKGRDGYKVAFAYVDASALDRPPVVYLGTDYYFLEGDQVLVVTLETHHDYEAALVNFRDFAVAVSMGGAR